MNPVDPGEGGPRKSFSVSDEGDDASPRAGVVGILPVAYISH